jgi:hypothetical protein
METVREQTIEFLHTQGAFRHDDTIYDKKWSSNYIITDISIIWFIKNICINIVTINWTCF